MQSSRCSLTFLLSYSHHDALMRVDTVKYSDDELSCILLWWIDEFHRTIRDKAGGQTNLKPNLNLPETGLNPNLSPKPNQVYLLLRIGQS